MAQPQVIYDQQYFPSGWFDHGGKTAPSWWDRDLASGVPHTPPVVIALDFMTADFVDNQNEIFLLDGGEGTPISQLPPGVPPTSGLWMQLEVGFFDDEDLFFMPMSLKGLDVPDQLLKNEIIRIR